MSSTPKTPEPEDLASGWNRLRSERLNSYEMVALELFAARGFDNVSVDDIAHEVGVSSRTLYRYFPTKEDFLLGYVRRNVYAVAAAISALPISDSPLEAVWDTINSYLVEELDGVRVMNLWRAAARTAPNVTAAAVGERALVLIEELNDYFAKCWNTDADTDPNPRLAAGMIVGIELASVLASGRTDMRRKNFDAAMRFTTSGIELASKKRARRT